MTYGSQLLQMGIGWLLCALKQLKSQIQMLAVRFIQPAGEMANVSGKLNSTNTILQCEHNEVRPKHTHMIQYSFTLFQAVEMWSRQLINIHYANNCKWILCLKRDKTSHLGI